MDTVSINVFTALMKRFLSEHNYSAEHNEKGVNANEHEEDFENSWQVETISHCCKKQINRNCK